MSIQNHLFSHKKGRFSNFHPSNCQGVDLNLDQFDLSAPERFASNAPSCSAALDSLEAQHNSFLMTGLGQFFEIFFVDFVVFVWSWFFSMKDCVGICKEILLEFSSNSGHFTRDFRNCHPIPKNDAEFWEGNWPLEVPKRQTLQTSPGSRSVGPCIFTGLAEGRVQSRGSAALCQSLQGWHPREIGVFFFPWENKDEVAKEMFGVSRMWKK